MKQMIDSPRMEGLAFQQEVLPQLPPGFRFHPTDEELLVHYLKKKVSSSPFPGSIIAEIDLYKYDPWDLPAKACFGEQEWYFFSPRDRKYPNGARPNRSAGSGYWKATGTDKPIVVLSGTTSSQKVGVKKSLVFYKGRPLKGLKTNWIMHEYRLAETTPTKRKGSLRLDDWVLCRIYKKLSHSPRLASCPDLEAPSPLATDMERSQPKSAMPKFGSFSKLLQSGDPFMESFLSHTTSDANAALSHVEPSSTHQVVPRQLNSSETRSYASMTMGFSGDEVSSVYPAQRQNTMNPPSSLQLQSSNQYMAGAGAVPDQHMYQLPLNENWNPEPPAWPLPTGNVWSSFDNG